MEKKEMTKLVGKQMIGAHWDRAVNQRQIKSKLQGQ